MPASLIFSLASLISLPSESIVATKSFIIMLLLSISLFTVSIKACNSILLSQLTFGLISVTVLERVAFSLLNTIILFAFSVFKSFKASMQF